MPAAEHRDQADTHGGTACVVDVGIGSHQRRPRCGPTWISKTEYRKTRFRTIRFVGCDAMPGFCVGLTIIPDDNANLVPTSSECFREQRLLDLLPTNTMAIVFRRKDREVFMSDETHLHGCGLLAE
ncbi:hypothetical protein ACVIIW_006663 [Bradyrhizobium sp. USDA 4449]